MRSGAGSSRSALVDEAAMGPQIVKPGTPARTRDVRSMVARYWHWECRLPEALPEVAPSDVVWDQLSVASLNTSRSQKRRRRHARAGDRGPPSRVSRGCRVAPFCQRCTRGYSRSSTAVTHRRQRVAVRPSTLPRGDPLGHGHIPLPAPSCRFPLPTGARRLCGFSVRPRIAPHCARHSHRSDGQRRARSKPSLSGPLAPLRACHF